MMIFVVRSKRAWWIITYLEAADVVGRAVLAVEVLGGLDGVVAGADEDGAHEGHAGVHQRRHAVRPEQAHVPRQDRAPVMPHQEHLLIRNKEPN